VTGPSPVMPAPEEAAGAGPRGKKPADKLSPYVRVVNAVWNGSGYIKRKKADHYVTHERGAFVDDACNQMVLNMRHPANIAAAELASVEYKRLDAGFKWHVGISGGATVMMSERTTGSDSCG
jgi:hypothetical protein